MKPVADNRKKTITAVALGVVALICIVYAYNTLFGGPSSPAPVAAPASTTAEPAATAPEANSSTTRNTGVKATMPGGNAPGVAATKMATTSSSLDPTLDETAMLRTESLVYSGTGRNIFSAIYVPPPPPIPTNMPSARPKGPVLPPPPPPPPPTPTNMPKARPGPVLPPPPPPPPPTCPPTCPPINLKFFGTAKRVNGQMQAFLLQGEDVYLASQGDIVARKYKIVSIAATNIQVTDLQNSNTQTLTLQAN
jgi:hypothetical protein